MVLDQAANFVRVTVEGTHSSSATTIQLASGEASQLPDPADGEYNLVWWDDANYKTADHDPEVEIVRVTGRDTGNDTITVERGQESTSATAKDTAGGDYMMILSTTAKMFSDIETGIEEAGTENLSEIDSLKAYKKAYLSIRNRRDYIDHIFQEDETRSDEITNSQVLMHYVMEAENDAYDRFIDPNHDLGLNAFNQTGQPNLTQIYEVALFLGPTSFVEGLLTIESEADYITNSQVLMDGLMESDPIFRNNFGYEA